MKGEKQNSIFLDIDNLKRVGKTNPEITSLYTRIHDFTFLFDNG